MHYAEPQTPTCGTELRLKPKLRFRGYLAGLCAPRRSCSHTTRQVKFYRDLLHRFGFRKGAILTLSVGFCSILNGQLYFEGIGGTNIGPNTLYLWLLSLESRQAPCLKPNRCRRSLYYRKPLCGDCWQQLGYQPAQRVDPPGTPPLLKASRHGTRKSSG